jgi:hypothetical protein
MLITIGAMGLVFIVLFIMGTITGAAVVAIVRAIRGGWCEPDYYAPIILIASVCICGAAICVGVIHELLGMLK